MANKNIRNIDALEKEILRLRVRQKEQELTLNRKLGRLRSGGALRILGTALFGARVKKEKPEASAFFSRLGDKLTDRLAGRLEEWVEKFFSKKQ
jgi:hypothetical protein